MERTNRTTALNQLNHWIHLTKVRSRNENLVREGGCPHELSCGYSRTCAIFFAPRPRAFTKIAIFVLQNVPNREVLQNEFRYDFRKGPREISEGTVFTVFTWIIAFNTVITVAAEISRGPFRKSYQNSFCKTSLMSVDFLRTVNHYRAKT